MGATASRSLSVFATKTYAAGSTISSAGGLPSNIQASQSYTDGAGAAAEIDTIAYAKLTVTPGSPSTPVTHDLEAITDVAGVSVDFAHIRGIYSVFTSGAALTECIIGNSGADAFEDAFMNGTTPAVVVPLTGIFAIDRPAGSTGWAVTTNETDLKYDFGTFATTNAVFEVLYIGNN